MKLTKSLPLTEMQKFHNKFYGKKKNYKVKSDTSGNIISLETTDQSIIKYASIID